MNKEQRRILTEEMSSLRWRCGFRFFIVSLFAIPLLVFLYFAAVSTEETTNVQSMTIFFLAVFTYALYPKKLRTKIRALRFKLAGE